MFGALRTLVEATGALAGKHRGALDSTNLEDAPATEGSVIPLISTVRKARGAVFEAALVPLSTATDAGGKPIIEWSDTGARDALTTDLVTDAENVLVAAPPAGRDRPEVIGLLALVGGRDVEPGETLAAGRSRAG